MRCCIQEESRFLRIQGLFLRAILVPFQDTFVGLKFTTIISLIRYNWPIQSNAFGLPFRETYTVVGCASAPCIWPLRSILPDLWNIPTPVAFWLKHKETRNRLSIWLPGCAILSRHGGIPKLALPKQTLKLMPPSKSETATAVIMPRRTNHAQSNTWPYYGGGYGGYLVQIRTRIHNLNKHTLIIISWKILYSETSWQPPFCC